jgi:hypothetical protein
LNSDPEPGEERVALYPAVCFEVGQPDVDTCASLAALHVQ